MPKIPISDQLDSRLKHFARPLEDTYETVISRALDALEQLDGSHEAIKETVSPSVEQVFDPFSHPSLTHTKMTFAVLDGKHLRSPNWNALLDETLRLARKRGGSTSFVKTYANVNIVEGKKTNEGYHYLSDVGFSVQGQDANDAWRAVAQLARRVGFAVEVHFFWRDKEGAALPGRNGSFRLERTAVRDGTG